MVDTKNHSVKRRLASHLKRPQVIGTLILALVIPFTYYMVGQQTQTRQRAATGDSVSAQNLSLTSSFKSISVYTSISGDTNNNSKAEVFVKKNSENAWKRVHDLYIDRIDKEGRGSIVGLDSNTAYNVKVVYADPDGVSGSQEKIENISTRNENIPLGSGTAYYVARSGNDGNPGTENQPFGTIQKALSSVMAGDTVYIKSGTYTESLKLTTSGTQNNYITITNYKSDSVILSGNKGSISDLITLENADYVNIRGLEIRDAAATLILLLGSDHVVVENNRLVEPAYGKTTGEITTGTVHLRNDSSYPVIRNNIMHRDTPMTTKMGIPAVMNWKAGKGSIIYGNTVTGGFEDGFRFAPEDSTSENRAQDLDIYDNRIDGACYDDGMQPEGLGINVRIWNNTLSRCFVAMAFAPTIKGPLYVFRNIVYDSKHPTRGGSALYKLGDEDPGRRGRKYFYHNTFYSNAPVSDVTGFKQTNSGIGNIISRNNIVHASRYVMEAGCDDQCSYDYDALFTIDPNRFIESGGRYGSPEEFCEIKGHECNGLEIDASQEFLNTSANDFRLKSSSVLVDRGVLLYGFNDSNSAWPSAGNGPDIGAYESGFTGNPVPTSSVPTATPTTGQTQPTPTPTVPIGGVTEKTTTLSLSPATANRTTGSTTTTNVSINTQNTITNADVSLTFNPNLIEVVDVTLGTFLPNAKEVEKSINNTTGKVLYSFYTDQNNAKTGTGTLATITWRAKAAGTNILAFDQNQTIVFGTQTGNTVTTNGLSSATYTITGTTVPTATPTTPVVQPTATNTPVPPTATPVVASCAIGSASWNLSQVDEGTLVTLRALISGANCLGKQVTFKVRENDSILEGGIDEDAATQPAPATISGSTVTTTWRAEWQNDCNGLCNDPEYYFNATLAGGNTVRSADPLLSVQKTETSLTLKLNLPYLASTQDLLNSTVTIRNTQTNQDTDKTVTLVPGLNNIYTGTLQSVLTPGNYALLVKRHQFLTKKFTFTVGNDTPNLDFSSTPLIGGDVNNDNVINTLDLGKVVEEYSPQQDTTAISDLTRDKRVNALDLGIVIENYFKQGESL